MLLLEADFYNSLKIILVRSTYLPQLYLNYPSTYKRLGKFKYEITKNSTSIQSMSD